MPDVIHRRIEKNKFGDVLLDELEIGIAAEVRNVVHGAGDKIVEADDLVAARHEQICQMRAEKSGGAGDDGSWLFVFQDVGWLNRYIVHAGRLVKRFNDSTNKRSAFENFTSPPFRAGRRGE